jgi:hypothetical protein
MYMALIATMITTMPQQNPMCVASLNSGVMTPVIVVAGASIKSAMAQAALIKHMCRGAITGAPGGHICL